VDETELSALPDERLLTKKETGALLKVSTVTFDRWAAKNIGPLSIRLSQRMTRYTVEDVRKWLLDMRALAVEDHDRAANGKEIF
jgi:predicted DNA-binding transcriptional regulator AlpA